MGDQCHYSAPVSANKKKFTHLYPPFLQLEVSERIFFFFYNLGELTVDVWSGFDFRVTSEIKLVFLFLETWKVLKFNICSSVIKNNFTYKWGSSFIGHPVKAAVAVPFRPLLSIIFKHWSAAVRLWRNPSPIVRGFRILLFYVERVPVGEVPQPLHMATCPFRDFRGRQANTWDLKHPYTTDRPWRCVYLTQ